MPQLRAPMDECVHANLRRLHIQAMGVGKRGKPRRRPRVGFGRGAGSHGEDVELEEEEEPAAVSNAVCSYCQSAELADDDRGDARREGDDVLLRCISHDEVPTEVKARKAWFMTEKGCESHVHLACGIHAASRTLE